MSESVSPMPDLPAGLVIPPLQEQPFLPSVSRRKPIVTVVKEQLPMLGHPDNNLALKNRVAAMGMRLTEAYQVEQLIRSVFPEGVATSQTDAVENYVMQVGPLSFAGKLHVVGRSITPTTLDAPIVRNGLFVGLVSDIRLTEKGHTQSVIPQKFGVISHDNLHTNPDFYLGSNNLIRSAQTSLPADYPGLFVPRAEEVSLQRIAEMERLLLTKDNRDVAQQMIKDSLLLHRARMGDYRNPRALVPLRRA